MRTKLFLLVAGITMVLVTRSLLAHHAFSAEFDAKVPVSLSGTVTKMEWINPHSWIHMDVKSADGKVVVWMIEGGAPNALLRRGFTKNSLLPGVEIAVKGFRAKDGSNRANGSELVFAADGRKLFMGSPDTGAPAAPAAPGAPAQ